MFRKTRKAWADRLDLWGVHRMLAQLESSLISGQIPPGPDPLTYIAWIVADNIRPMDTESER